MASAPSPAGGHRAVGSSFIGRPDLLAREATGGHVEYLDACGERLGGSGGSGGFGGGGFAVVDGAPRRHTAALGPARWREAGPREARAARASGAERLIVAADAGRVCRSLVRCAERVLVARVCVHVHVLAGRLSDSVSSMTSMIGSVHCVSAAVCIEYRSMMIWKQS